MTGIPLRPACAVTLLLSLLAGSATAAPEPVRIATPMQRTVVVAAASQPDEYRYLAFPSLLRTGDDEIWIVCKAGRSHATDAGAAMQVMRHALSSGATTLLQRMPAPPPKLYQMGELTRFPDGTIACYIDVQSAGWDGRHYRSGAEVFRWNPNRRQFDTPVELGVIDGVLYGYPFDFISEGGTTWQLVMAFGYHLPGGRWSVDALRSEDSGRSWSFVRNLTKEFGDIKGNESGFTRYGDGFIVTTRGYDRIERLHRTDREFRVRHQVELSGKYPFLNSYIGRPRLFIRDGRGYMIGRNWTRPTGPQAERGSTASEMQLCLIRFDPETLAVDSCVILDNADNQKVTDGYYADTTFSGPAENPILHVVSYKALNQQPPDIVRFDFRWSEIK